MSAQHELSTCDDLAACTLASRRGAAPATKSIAVLHWLAFVTLLHVELGAEGHEFPIVGRGCLHPCEACEQGRVFASSGRLGAFFACSNMEWLRRAGLAAAVTCASLLAGCSLVTDFEGYRFEGPELDAAADAHLVELDAATDAGGVCCGSGCDGCALFWCPLVSDPATYRCSGIPCGCAQ